MLGEVPLCIYNVQGECIRPRFKTSDPLPTLASKISPSGGLPKYSCNVPPTVNIGAYQELNCRPFYAPYHPNDPE